MIPIKLYKHNSILRTLDPAFFCILPAPASRAATMANMVRVLPVPGGPCNRVTVGLLDRLLELGPLDPVELLLAEPVELELELEVEVELVGRQTA